MKGENKWTTREGLLYVGGVNWFGFYIYKIGVTQIALWSFLG